MDKLVDLFKNANDESSWVRVPVVQFLRACPEPKAKEYIDELAKIDPDAVKRATNYLALPGASGPAVATTAAPAAKADASAEAPAELRPQLPRRRRARQPSNRPRTSRRRPTLRAPTTLPPSCRRPVSVPNLPRMRPPSRSPPQTASRRKNHCKASRPRSRRTRTLMTIRTTPRRITRRSLTGNSTSPMNRSRLGPQVRPLYPVAPIGALSRES